MKTTTLLLLLLAACTSKNTVKQAQPTPGPNAFVNNYTLVMDSDGARVVYDTLSGCVYRYQFN